MSSEAVMSGSGSGGDGLPQDYLEVRRRRVLFRSWHRGTQEIDLIFGPFAEAYLLGFDSAQLDRFEALLDCADADLFDWTIGGIAAPREYDHDVMCLLRGFCAARPHRSQQNGQHQI